MKRILLILFTIGFTSGMTAMAAMSTSRVRKDARFLTDRMAYELNLSPAQYNDTYEINYDFINSIRYVIDDVVDGEEWALNDYYHYLDIRNDDLRWVLTDSQYRRLMRTDYFYRPVYASGGKWYFRVYITYTNHNYFYFGKPYHYRTYYGGHYRTHNNNVSFYRGRYHHPFYSGPHSVRDHRVYHTHRRSDFGSVKIRPNTSTRPATRPSTRPATRPSTRPSRVDGTSSSRPGNSVHRNESTAPGRVSSGSSRRENATTVPKRDTNNSSRKDNTTTTPGRNTSSSRRESTTTSPRRDINSSSRSRRETTTPSRRTNSSSSRSTTTTGSRKETTASPSRSSSNSSSSRSSSSRSSRTTTDNNSRSSESNRSSRR